MPQTAAAPASPPQDDSRVRRSLVDHLKAASELEPDPAVGAKEDYVQEFLREEAALLKELPASVQQRDGHPEAAACGTGSPARGQQPLVNMELGAAVKACEAAAAQFGVRQVEEAAESSRALQNVLSGYDAALTDYQGGWTWEQGVDADERAMQQGAQLELPPPAVQRLVSDWADPAPTAATVARCMRELLDADLPVSQSAAVEAELEPLAGLTRQYGLVGRALEVHRRMRRGAVEVDRGPSPAEVRLKGRVAELEAAQVEAVDLADPMREDDMQLQIITTLEELMENIRARLKAVMAEEDDSDAQGGDSGGAEAAAAWRADLEGLKAHVIADEERLQKYSKQVAEEGRGASAEHAGHLNESWAGLQANADSQAAIFRHVCELVGELGQLQEQRQQLAQQHQELVRAEARRRAEHGRLTELIDQHQPLLSDLEHKAAVAVQCSNSLSEFFPQAMQILEQQRLRREALLEEARQKVMTDYLNTFRKYYNGVGELHFRKEQVMQKVERQLRNERLHIETAARTHDPDLGGHREAAEVFARRHGEIGVFCQQLVDKLEEEERLFEPVGEALRELGTEFVHPRDELEAHLLEQENSLLSSIRSFVDTERAHADSKNHSLLQRSARSQMRQQALDEAAETRRKNPTPKKVSHKTASMIATSPTRARTTGSPSAAFSLGLLSSSGFVASGVLSTLGSASEMGSTMDVGPSGSRPQSAPSAARRASGARDGMPPRPRTAGAARALR